MVQISAGFLLETNSVSPSHYMNFINTEWSKHPRIFKRLLTVENGLMYCQKIMVETARKQTKIII